MSLENEDDSSAMEASDSINESEKKPRFSYTRDFLLSLSELEICKSLPSGFDQSILREFEENSIPDRPRTHGNLPLQGFRRNDYSSSPPTRGDSSNFSRGGYGRWDNRSSGWSDKDGDSQSDMHSDSGRSNYGNQSRRPWQNFEHDGLLGSGSFPRPSGFAGGSSAPKGPTNEHYHLNRSTEAYQPPRPFKAGPPSRSNTHDSFNDETFGSIESTSQDRAEEERKRRASFELMRKEQQKVLQEKQKMNANKVKGDDFTDLVLEEIKEEGVPEASGDLKTAVQSVPKDDYGKSSILLLSSKPRPLVPPGFRSTILEKCSTTKLVSSIEKENPKPGIEEIHLLAQSNYTPNGIPDNQVNIQSANHHMHRNSGFSEVHEAVDGEVFELATNNIISSSSQESTTSILGKFFGSGPTIKDGGPTGFHEPKSKPDDPFSPFNVQSSKFAQWFIEDEKKIVDDLSSSRQNDLLSLIGGGDKAVSQVPNIISTNLIAPELPYMGFGITETHSGSKHLNNSRQESAPPPVVAVLTCEDLEQTILSEYSEKSSNSQPPVPDWSVSSQENVNAIAVNNHATHHLLSLLQKGTAIDDGLNTNISPVEAHPISEKPKDGNNQEAASAGQNLSLEALFGTAFMKELQSAQAPVSAQRAPPGPAYIEPHEVSDVSNVDGIGPTMTSYESNPISLKQKHPTKSDDPENWLNVDGQRVGVNSSCKRAIGTGEIQLPEEESLIIGGEAANSRNSNIGNMLPAEVAFDISEKLAALNAGNRLVRGPYDMMEPERQFNNHNQRPMFHPLDPNPQHMNSQMRFPEHLMQRETHPNQQFPGSMQIPFHHPEARVTGFNVPVNVHPQMLPQMRMQSNIPPPHMLRDLQRPQASNFMPVHGSPFPHQQTNTGGLGLPLSVADASSGHNHPEALQRMLEMERWAQSKQVRPVNAGHSHGMYGSGHELDMGFRYI